MFSDSKLVIACGLPSSKTLKSAGVRPLTNRPSPSVTTAVSWTTSTSTASLCLTPLVCTVAAARPPGVLGRDPDGVLPEAVARVPVALERLACDRADLLSVSEENQFLDLFGRRRWFDDGDQPEEPAGEPVVDR